MLHIDPQFPHLYEVDELHELPGTGQLDIPLLYFPRPKTRPEHDGLWLKIYAGTASSWVGVFAFGNQSAPAFTEVVSTPHPKRVCVISRGAAYIVNTEDPDDWEEIPIMPVVDVRSIPQYQLLVFADFQRLAAYGSSGLVWRSPPLCWDELKILGMTGNSIEGVGYDPTKSNSESRFALDIKTGQTL